VNPLCCNCPSRPRLANADCPCSCHGTRPYLDPVDFADFLARASSQWRRERRTDERRGSLDDAPFGCVCAYCETHADAHTQCDECGEPYPCGARGAAAYPPDTWTCNDCARHPAVEEARP